MFIPGVASLVVSARIGSFATTMAVAGAILAGVSVNFARVARRSR